MKITNEQFVAQHKQVLGFFVAFAYERLKVPIAAIINEAEVRFGITFTRQHIMALYHFRVSKTPFATYLGVNLP